MIIDIKKSNINCINDIFNYYNDIELFANYLGISNKVIEKCIIEHSCINSPLRIDVHPSVTFYQQIYKGIVKTKMRDFAGYFWGDIIDLLCYINSWNISTDFDKIIDTIEHLASSTSGNKAINVEKHFKEFLIYPRSWNNHDKFYWSKYNIPLSFLEEEKVYPIGSAYKTDANDNYNILYNYNNTNQVGYAYYKLTEDNKTYWELYFPYNDRKSDKKRFISNGDILHGITTLKKEKVFILTKSNKDRILIKYLARKYKLSITSLAIPSEGRVLNEAEYNNIKAMGFEKIYSLYDLDKTGIKGMKVLKSNYNIIPIILPRISKSLTFKVGTYRNIAKDISDLIFEQPKIEKNLINRFKQLCYD